MKDIFEMAKSAAGTAGAAAGVTVGGVSVGASPLLIGLAQAVVVVVGVLRGLDKREKRRAAEMSLLRGEVQTVLGRVNGLRCQAHTPLIALPTVRTEDCDG